ncbi:MAG: AraC family transcriptional regulator [Pseudomonadota bacterium]
MSDDYVFQIDGDVGTSVAHLTPRGHACTLSGLSVMAMPPGKVNIEMQFDCIGLNVLPYGPDCMRRGRLNGEKFLRRAHDFGSRSVLMSPGDLELVAENPAWECLIELQPDRAIDLMAERFDGALPDLPSYDIRHDHRTFTLAEFAIDHLRSGDQDRLYVEGLGIAMMGRAIVGFDREVRPVPTRGTDARVARTIDYAEANLSEPLSIAELAAVAGMSPSWFRDCFRTATGMPVHAYVRERRLQRARRLLTDTPRAPLAARPSIQQVAHACGFADQSHLTRAFKRRFGVTPGEARDG